MLHLPYVDPSLNKSEIVTDACILGDGRLVQALLDDERVQIDNGYRQCISCALLSGNDSVTGVVLRHEKTNPLACRRHASLFGWDDRIAEALAEETSVERTVAIYRDYYAMLDTDCSEVERREREVERRERDRRRASLKADLEDGLVTHGGR